jgi:Bifunctional DNA primase/polymerase, N-terminal/Primase C terminal 1 (PriCT-1)
VNAIGEAAVALAVRTGWRLFPVNGKAPATQHGFLDATASPDELHSLFSARPDADGMAVACGTSGLAVLDVDVKAGADGRDSLREAELPWLGVETVRATTPSGGEHCFFTGSLPSRTGILLGVDIKSVGGYVVLPEAGGRTWLADASPWDIRPVPVPAWLVRLAGAGRQSGPRKWEDAVAGYVGEGARNVTAASIAGHLLTRGVEPKLAALLVVAWARSFCDPPLEDREALGVVRSIVKREGL